MSDIQRDVQEMDVVFVGAGPSNLAAAYHLSRLIKEHNEAVATGKKQGQKLEIMAAIVEKGKNVGDHMLSGAILDPSAIRELMP
ncbi:MAG TPA: electron transfer flavoprotein-ubiquinone oxidoreductase, partial [bacterium]|nr:electron transfer flavoprotein-ubiquinone oxidoreductase [bacterium]